MLTQSQIHDLIMELHVDLATVATAVDAFNLKKAQFNITIGDDETMYASAPSLLIFVARARRALFGDLPVLGFDPDAPGFHAFNEYAAQGSQLDAETMTVSSTLWDSLELTIETEAARTLLAGICQRLLAELTSCALRGEDVRPTLTRIASMEGLVKRLGDLEADQFFQRAPFIVERRQVVCTAWPANQREAIAHIKSFLQEHLEETCKVSFSKDGETIRVTAPGKPTISFSSTGEWLAIDLIPGEKQIVILESEPYSCNKTPDPSKPRTV